MGDRGWGEGWGDGERVGGERKMMNDKIKTLFRLYFAGKYLSEMRKYHSTRWDDKMIKLELLYSKPNNNEIKY